MRFDGILKVLLSFASLGSLFFSFTRLPISNEINVVLGSADEVETIQIEPACFEMAARPNGNTITSI